MAQKLIAQGAEARIYRSGGRIVKDRFEKGYRISEIDSRLRKSRTRVEAKILNKLTGIGFPCPKVLGVDDQKGLLEMELVKGQKVRDILEKKDYKKLCKEIGKKVSIFHDNSIIHGDLTTSNMILEDKSNEIYFIDFGLGFISHKVEDMAVDLHLLKQALESKHYNVWQECFKSVLAAYRPKNRKEVLARLDVVESRGRNKAKY